MQEKLANKTAEVDAIKERVAAFDLDQFKGKIADSKDVVKKEIEKLLAEHDYAYN